MPTMTPSLRTKLNLRDAGTERTGGFFFFFGELKNRDAGKTEYSENHVLSPWLNAIH